MVHEEKYQKEEACGTKQNNDDNDNDGDNNNFMARLSITRVTRLQWRYSRTGHMHMELCHVLLVCIPSRNNSEPKQIWDIKALFIIPTDAHNYKMTGMLKQLKFPQLLRHVSVHSGLVSVTCCSEQQVTATNPLFDLAYIPRDLQHTP